MIAYGIFNAVSDFNVEPKEHTLLSWISEQ